MKRLVSEPETSDIVRLEPLGEATGAQGSQLGPWVPFWALSGIRRPDWQDLAALASSVSRLGLRSLEVTSGHPTWAYLHARGDLYKDIEEDDSMVFSQSQEVQRFKILQIKLHDYQVLGASIFGIRLWLSDEYAAFDSYMAKAVSEYVGL